MRIIIIPIRELIILIIPIRFRIANTKIQIKTITLFFPVFLVFLCFSKALLHSN